MLLSNEKDRINFVKEIGYSACTCQQIIAAIHKWVIDDSGINDEQKAKIVILICDTECNLFEGGRDDLNLLLFFDKLSKILKN